MEIDKQNGNVVFNNAFHKYWDITDESKKYISVTTLIERYGKPFNESFWSKYKTLQKIAPDVFLMEKKNLLLKKKWNKEILKNYGISENEFEKVRKDILNEWKQKNEEACKRGTKIHADIENSFYINPNNKELEKFVKGGKFVCKKNYTDLDLEYGVYPEYLIYRESDDGILLLAGQVDLIIKKGNHITIVDHKTNERIDTQGFYDSATKSTIKMKYPEYLIYRESDDGILLLAGQVDLIIKKGNHITIVDHKTNERIDTQGFYDSATKSTVKMKYPLNKLDDTNFWHYTMQLSTYAWMLQKINPNFIIDDLILNHYDHQGNNRLYHCEYLKNEVEKMLAHYKKQLILEKNREKRKRIEY